MFNNDIALAGTSVSNTFSLQSVVGGKSIRSDATAALGEPRYLTISHQAVSRPWGTADRHLIRLDRSFPGEFTTDPTLQASVQLVIEAPRTVVTAAEIQNLIDQMEAFTGTSGYVAKILNSEP
jgi:hypothetical protein